MDLIDKQLLLGLLGNFCHNFAKNLHISCVVRWRCDKGRDASANPRQMRDTNYTISLIVIIGNQTCCMVFGACSIIWSQSRITSMRGSFNVGWGRRAKECGADPGSSCQNPRVRWFRTTPSSKRMRATRHIIRSSLVDDGVLAREP